jgi:hypothetical protein
LCLLSDGRYNEAEELFVQVMETRKRVLGAEHPDTLTSMANLAFTWKSQDRNDKAISLLRECLRLQERLLGPQHADTKSSLQTITKWQVEKSNSKRPKRFRWLRGILGM